MQFIIIVINLCNNVFYDDIGKWPTSCTKQVTAMSYSLPVYNRATATTSCIELVERYSLQLSSHTHRRHWGICEYSPEATNIVEVSTAYQDENLIRLVGN